LKIGQSRVIISPSVFDRKVTPREFIVLGCRFVFREENMKPIALVFFPILCLFLLFYVACSMGGGFVDVMTFAPDGDYQILAGIAPSRIVSSAFFKDLMDKVEFLRNNYKSLEKNASDMGIGISELGQLVFLLNPQTSDGLALIQGGSASSAENVVNGLHTKGGMEFDKKDIGGRVYWENRNLGVATNLAGGTVFFSSEEVMKKAIGAMQGNGGKLAGNQKFLDALSLIDVNADAYMLFQGSAIQLIISPSVEDEIRELCKDAALAKEVAGAYDALDAIGIIINFGKGFELRERFRFRDEGSAETLMAFNEKYRDELLKRTGLEFGMLARGFGLDIEGADIEKIQERVKIERVGTVLHAALRFDDSKEIIELLNKVFGSERQVNQLKTVEHIRSIAVAIESYLLDYPEIGAPRTTDANELINILLEQGYLRDKDIIYDGWGNLLVYQYDTSGQTHDYTVSSYGADGQPGPPVPKVEDGIGLVTREEEDIIFHNGIFVQCPRERR
jgi:hypothetical protein